MGLFDNNPQDPTRAGDEPLRAVPGSPESPITESATPLLGDPISYVAVYPASARAPQSNLPEDLRISWSWPHLLLFIFFVIASQLMVAFGALAYLSAGRHLTQRQLSHFESDPKFVVTVTVLWFALIIFFLYMTLSVLRGLPFWKSLGWRKFSADPFASKGRPWMYFVAGSGLSIFVLVVGSRVKSAEHLPIEDMFKSRTGAMLLMSTAVLVAPLAEETIFRGYLYPVIAKIVTAVVQFFGLDSSSAIRTGVASSIVTTGMLFGLMHGVQLGWTWGLVGLLTLVGVIFTFARAWTGTVLASFFLPLGYNSMLAVLTIVSFSYLHPHP